MAQNQKTLYEVLGVTPNAKNTDIGRAYNRFKAAMQKEDAAPDPRRAAMAKVAFETLSDPERRAQYDASLAPGQGAKRKPVVAALAAIVLLGVAGAAYLMFGRHAPAPAVAGPLEPQQLLQGAAPYVGRLQIALMSGEVRPAGVAIATGAGEMATTCHGLPAGAQLTLTLPGGVSKAEISRANEELDVCLLDVKDPPADFVKLRGGEPAPGERIYAVLAEGARPNELKQGRIKGAIADPKGALLELDIGGAFPTGTPVLDSRGRLVGLITTPHSFGEGLVVALGAARIEQARTAAPNPGK
jgi:hypothetical protein